MFKIYILGISEQYLNDDQKKILASASLIIGTKRFENLVQHCHGSFQLINPLPEAITSIKNTLLKGNVCVLASGDPLFFGIGKLLLKNFPRDCIEISPALSALQRACAVFKISWDDAEIISLHGRQIYHAPGRILHHPKTIIFTDTRTKPNTVAKEIIDYLELIGEVRLLDKIIVHVAEDLGLDTQNVVKDSLSNIAQCEFSSLNIICIENPQNTSFSTYNFGLKEEDIIHSRGLITKNEVRASTLHQLQLPQSGIFWDIGAGSGSISIEAARSNPQLTVYAIEHKSEEIENIKKNVALFGCYNIVPILGAAPDILDQLPSPDRVFVGGSGGSLQSIISHVADRFSIGNERLVINGVIKKTVTQAPKLLITHGFKVNKSIVSVSREDHLGNSVTFNPITIITGTK